MRAGAGRGPAPARRSCYVPRSRRKANIAVQRQEFEVSDAALGASASRGRSHCLQWPNDGGLPRRLAQSQRAQHSSRTEEATPRREFWHGRAGAIHQAGWPWRAQRNRGRVRAGGAQPLAAQSAALAGYCVRSCRESTQSAPANTGSAAVAGIPRRQPDLPDSLIIR